MYVDFNILIHVQYVGPGSAESGLPVCMILRKLRSQVYLASVIDMDENRVDLVR